ncbi:hypothetical protein NDU88_006491 [Pleurodeles waltl]|uniref:Uncharacterized protein n=1 Tax=Pleurodeles waltl TaxID=8319 RepID=A0AAV7X1Q0_PLEWA|nr:hypothetical protein NDU88_006491 [Pleurodeles waltl]
MRETPYLERRRCCWRPGWPGQVYAEDPALVRGEQNDTARSCVLFCCFSNPKNTLETSRCAADSSDGEGGVGERCCHPLVKESLLPAGVCGRGGFWCLRLLGASQALLLPVKQRTFRAARGGSASEPPDPVLCAARAASLSRISLSNEGCPLPPASSRRSQNRHWSLDRDSLPGTPKTVPMRGGREIEKGAWWGHCFTAHPSENPPVSTSPELIPAVEHSVSISTCIDRSGAHKDGHLMRG